jgi:hypothetical protein
MLNRNQEYLVASVPEVYRNDSAALAANTGTINKATCESFLLKNCTVDVGDQLGDLPWAAHNLWLQYRYTMDEAMLERTVFPILKRAVGFYLRLSHKDPTDRKIHLPQSESPEYGTATDVNYDLALFKWGCTTLLYITQVQCI